MDRPESGAGRIFALPLVAAPPWSRPDRTGWRWAVAISIVAVYVVSYSPHWSIGWDSGLYLNLGRSIARGQGYTLAGIPQVHVPPAFPAMLAALMRVGAGSFAALNAVMCVLGLATVLAVYLMLSQFVHRDWALAITGALAISKEMTGRSGEILSDIPFMLVATAGLWLYARGIRDERPDRRWWEVGSLLLIASAWVRVVGFPLAAGAALGVVFSARGPGRRRAAVNLAVVAAGLAASLAFFAWYYRTHADPTAASYVSTMEHFKGAASAWRLLSGPFATLYQSGADLSRLYTGQPMPAAAALVALLLPVAAAVARRWTAGERLSVLAVIAYVGAMALLWPVVRTRYILPVMPFLALYLVEGYAYLLGLLNRRISAKVAITFVVILAGFNLPPVARNIMLKHGGDYPAEQQHGEWRDALEAVDIVKWHVKAGENILSDQMVSYLADAPSPTIARGLLESAPTEEEITALLAKWRIAYVVVDKRTPSRFFNAVEKHLAGAGQAVFASGGIMIYEVAR